MSTIPNFESNEDDAPLDERGRIQWDALRRTQPEISRLDPAPAGNAGAGTGPTVPGSERVSASVGMTQWIRRQAGR